MVRVKLTAKTPGEGRLVALFPVLATLLLLSGCASPTSPDPVQPLESPLAIRPSPSLQSTSTPSPSPMPLPPTLSPTPSPSDTPSPPAVAKPTRPVEEIEGLFDVGGHRLYLHCTGTGSPAVVLEAGYGDTGQTWSRVQPAVAEFTRVCAYDRAGLGRSDRVPAEPTYVRAAFELHTLLGKASVGEPYILAGHSAGGWTVRLYADRYPDEVAGLVLVDSSHPDQFRRDAEVLPPESPDESESLRFYREWFTTATVESSLTPETYAPGSLGDLPLVVLTAPQKERADDLPAGLSAAFDRIWIELQDELALLSSASTHILVEDSGHFIQQDRPDVVVQAIRQVVDMATARKR